MRLSEALSGKQFDVRLQDKYLSDGVITKEQFVAYQNGLENEEDNDSFEMISIGEEKFQDGSNNSSTEQ